MKKKCLAAFLALIFCAGVSARSAGAVSTSAASAVLMEARSGRVLYAQNAWDRRLIASTTKLMTALVAAEHTTDLDATVRVDPAAVGVEGSSMYLAAGEELSMRELLYGLLLHSGNDAAVAVAIGCAGDTDTFVAWMNQKAQALGMTGSHFENPNGLDGAEHYSCAYDLALLGRAVLENPQLAQITATRSVTLGGRQLTNHNKLLWRYPGCVGLKTGYTRKAGRTLVSAATRGDTTLIAVTLNDGNDWADHAALLDYGFANYRSHLLCRREKVLGRVPVRGSVVPAVTVKTAEDVYACLGAAQSLTAQLRLSPSLSAPVRAGDVVGTLVFLSDGQEVASAPLLAATTAMNHRAS